MASKQAVTRLVQLRAGSLADTSISRAACAALEKSLGRNPPPSTEVLTDRASTTPSKTRFRSHVHILHDPALSVSERADLSNEKNETLQFMLKCTSNSRRIRQTPPTAWRVFTDGSVKTGRRAGGAGAASIYPPGATLPLLSKTKRGGKRISSYSAEQHGLSCGADLIDAAAPPQGSVIYWFTDSQGSLAALAKGVRRQTDARSAKLWNRLLALSEHGYSIFLVFLYSHIGEAEMDAIDELAGEAARTGAQTSDPKHPSDVIRPISDDLETGNDVPGTLRNFAGVTSPPPRWNRKDHNALGHLSIRRLCQLRTDSCPEIGGHLVEDYPCHRCGAATARGKPSVASMVKHIFHCPQATPLRRQLRIRGISDLWKRVGPTLEYVRFFLVSQTS